MWIERYLKSDTSQLLIPEVLQRISDNDSYLTFFLSLLPTHPPALPLLTPLLKALSVTFNPSPAYR